MLGMLTRHYIYKFFRPVHVCLTVKSPVKYLEIIYWFTVYLIAKEGKKKKDIFKILGRVTMVRAQAWDRRKGKE